MSVQFLYCHRCGKMVSTGFTPVPTDTPDKGLIVRAYIICPECIEKRETTKLPDTGSKWLFDLITKPGKR